jgi:hypothetical protein
MALQLTHVCILLFVSWWDLRVPTVEMVCRYAFRQHTYYNHGYIRTITDVQLLHQYIYAVEMVTKNTI